ncbi:hypothetical protein AMTR_s00201p00010840 [Amborella trichopoda]|uniref:Retrotransposon gag domain-containing protein n=1 Tax=Amborella trichopoda TaxID=13333 RepID=W1NMP1_AMBTC|nr:hypothetical protein AMTR_s00201p00010840 [Amborella trichopoda]
MKTDKAIHDKLEKDHASPSLTRTLTIKQYPDLKMPEGGKIADYMQRFRALLQELEAVQLKLDENTQLFHLLNSLPSA